MLGKIFNDVEIKGWCKEQELKNGVLNGVRIAAAAEPELAMAR